MGVGRGGRDGGAAFFRHPCQRCKFISAPRSRVVFLKWTSPGRGAMSRFCFFVLFTMLGGDRGFSRRARSLDACGCHPIVNGRFDYAYVTFHSTTHDKRFSLPFATGPYKHALLASNLQRTFSWVVAHNNTNITLSYSYSSLPQPGGLCLQVYVFHV